MDANPRYVALPNYEGPRPLGLSKRRAAESFSQLPQLRIAVLDRSIVDLDNYGFWLDPGMTSADAASNLLKPCDALVMRSYRVSSRVNHATMMTRDAQCRAFCFSRQRMEMNLN